MQNGLFNLMNPTAHVLIEILFIQGQPFFLKMLEKLLNIFLNLFFYLKVQSFRSIMENNFIQIVASTGHAVTYTIGPNFKHIIDCHCSNGFTNFVIQSVNYLWLVGETLIFDGTPQIVV